MVSIFNALMASGLEGFLGCPAVLYEAALVDFFENGSVRDGLVVSTVNGVLLEITEQLFAEAFELPVDGFSELSEISKDKVFDARSLVSLTGEPVSTSGKKIQMKIEYRLLCDIMAKTISMVLGSRATNGGHQTCCSKIFEGRTRDRGAVIARSNTNKKSSCWIRTMLRVDGTLVIEPCADYWKPIPQEVSSSTVVIPSRLSYLPPVSEFFKVMTKRWSDVCLEVIKFFASRRLLPVGSVNFCSALSVVEPVNSFVSHQPTVFALRLSQFCTVFIRYSLFSRLSTEDIRNFVSSIVFERTALRDVQRSFVSAASQNVQLAFSSVFEDEDDQMDIDQRLASPTTTADSSMKFIDNDILLGDDATPSAFATDYDATPNQPSLPTVATNLSTFLDNLRTSLSERIDSQSEDIERINDSKSDILSKLNTIDKGLRDALLQQGEDLRKLIQNVRQDCRTLDDVQTLGFNEFRKVTSLDEQVAATRNDLLEFSAQAQETLNHITGQLSELIAYINRGGNDKKGEVSSSRPQTPPDDQNRGSGNMGGGSGARTTDIVERFSGSLSREGRGRGSGGSRSRGHSKKRYPSSGGGQFRRSFDDWLG
ncbi:hypothetical protein F511_39586 [Dorcoceras hygrometricum]|uniref:Uncharacterized protein n=1 Tax=Dorcoceras hygrometricum TaxID=472368 RepID=A0A2Z7BBI0_9LAMI|nr:hypothetical protein F511_39586 [Dorcoceras hygrometricum]